MLIKPAKKAIQTAQILSELTKFKYASINGLQEINFGEWEALTWNEMKEKYPVQYWCISVCLLFLHAIGISEP